MNLARRINLMLELLIFGIICAIVGAVFHRGKRGVSERMNGKRSSQTDAVLVQKTGCNDLDVVNFVYRPPLRLLPYSCHEAFHG